MSRTAQTPDPAQDSAPRNSATDDFRAKAAQVMNESRVESEALGRELSEIEMLLRQTNGEVEKLAQRELGMTNRVRDMELNLDNYSRTDMKTIYNSAHEIQMRLFMMRAQVEQLEAKRNSMRLLQQRIGRFTGLLQSVPDDFNPGGMPMRGHGSGPLMPRIENQTSDESAANKAVLGQVIQAQEDERLYVSRQIHDGPASTLR